MKEMKKNNNNGYTFEEALLQKSTIKMEDLWKLLIIIFYNKQI